MQRYEERLAAVLSDLEQALRAVDEAQLTAVCDAVLSARRVFVAGKGRSGLQMRGFAMRLMHLGLTVHVVDDVTTPAIGAADLLVLGTASGRTPSVVGWAQKARGEGASVLLVTTVAESPAAASATTIIRLNAATPKVVASTGLSLPMGAVFEQALGILLDIAIARLMERLDIDEAVMMTRHANLE